ncbi:MAG: M24 family metallopeptidase, partial [Paracoccus sp. (in: a-proteobacteria)]
HKMGVVKAFIGHGIGEQFHTDIHVPHYYDSRNSMIMRPGMTFTVEPMLPLGAPACAMWDDDWTAVTRDKSLSAQFEHSIGVTSQGFEIFTPSDRFFPDF